MISDFRKKKLLHVFKTFFDANGSGEVDREDVDYTIDALSKVRGWPIGSAKRKEFESYMNTIWEDLERHGDQDSDGKVSPEEWVAMWDDYAKKCSCCSHSSVPQWQSTFCKMTFWLQDNAGDGVIDADEYSSTYAIYGLDKQKSTEAFNKMSQGKKTLNFDEYQKLFNEYFIAEDPAAPGNFVFASD